MAEALIKTEHVKVVYNQGKENEFVALSDINVEIFSHEYVIFFGPSGCGKSTLLYTIQGLQKPAEGKVYIKGRNTATFTEKQNNLISSRFYGIVFQNFNLIYSLNVVDNVALPQMFTKASPKERKSRAMELLKRFGIDSKSELLPSTLSGGQQQRTSICRALINDPQVILADEPVGNLDSESATIVMETLKEINDKDKKTVVLVTHDASYLKYADRIYYFKDGRIDRMVVNPKSTQKYPEQMKKDQEMSNELERLARVHPNLTAAELKAWSLTNFLIEECTSRQIERIERAMEKLLDGKMSENQFYEKLCTPFSDGGVGLYKATALRFTLRISRLLSAVEQYEVNAASYSDEARKVALAHVLVRFMLEEYSGILSAEQYERLEKLIVRRLSGTLSSLEFSHLLNVPWSQDGVGLKTVTAERLTDRLELVLALHSS